MVLQMSHGVGTEVSETVDLWADPTWDWEDRSGAVLAARRGAGGRARAAGSCACAVRHSTKVQRGEHDGSLKEKSAIRNHREYLGRQRNFTGYHCWVRGYCVSTVGVAEDTIREYIRQQEADEKKQEKLELGLSKAPSKGLHHIAP